MKKKIEKKRLKKELKSLLKSMDYINDNYLSKKGVDDKEIEVFANVYQQLGIAWEFLRLQCRHWDGYKKTRDKKKVCKICGKVRKIDETHILLPLKGHKKIGRRKTPDSKKTFLTQKKANILYDSICFHGASLKVDVHNSYKSKLFKKELDINMTAERIVQLKESGVECAIDQHTINIRIGPKKAKVVANCDHLSTLKFSPSLPYVFTEHGAIMAARH